MFELVCYVHMLSSVALLRPYSVVCVFYDSCYNRLEHKYKIYLFASCVCVMNRCIKILLY